MEVIDLRLEGKGGLGACPRALWPDGVKRCYRWEGAASVAAVSDCLGHPAAPRQTGRAIGWAFHLMSFLGSPTTRSIIGASGCMAGCLRQLSCESPPDSRPTMRESTRFFAQRSSHLRPPFLFGAEPQSPNPEFLRSLRSCCLRTSPDCPDRFHPCNLTPARHLL